MTTFKKNKPKLGSILHHSERLATHCYPTAGTRGAQKNFLSRIQYAILKGHISGEPISDREVNGWARDTFPDELKNLNLPSDFSVSVTEGASISDRTINIPSNYEELVFEYLKLASVNADLQAKQKDDGIKIKQLTEDNSALRGKKREGGRAPKTRY